MTGTDPVPVFERWFEAAHQIVRDNSPRTWAIAALGFVLVFAIEPLLRRFVRARTQKYRGDDVPTAPALIAHLVDHTSRLVMWVLALYVAVKLLVLPHRFDQILDIAIVLGVWLQVGIWLASAVEFGLLRQTVRSGDPHLSGTMGITLFVTNLVIWVLVVLLALQNMGVSVGPLLTGLGVGGIAIALAVQTILGDLFASLSIALDKPFVAGDWLKIDNFEGTVEKIGIKSTRLRSFSGEQIVIANADLLKSRVRNISRSATRRTLFNLAVDTDCPVPQVEQVPEIVAAAVRASPEAQFSYCWLTTIGETIQFEVCYFLDFKPGEIDSARILDQVNRQILRGLSAAGIRLAVPARNLRMASGFERYEHPQQHVEQQTNSKP